VYLQIAGLTICVTSVEPDLALVPGAGAARFVVDPAPPDVRVRVVARQLPSEVASERIFDSGGPWQLHRRPGGFLFRFFSSTLGPAPYQTADFNHDFTSGEICVHRPYLVPGHPIDPLAYPLDELLVINLLGQGRGLEVHGCGLVDGSETGYLFVGQSGAGKTTMARLWLAEPGVEILSDDRVVLRGGDDGVWMYGTPWHGDAPLASPRRARLSQLSFLRQHDRHACAALAPSVAAARLLAASFPAFYDAAALDFTLRFIEEVVRAVPARDLAFAPVPGVIEFLRRQR